MSQITINNVNGAPPYNIYVCDFNQYDCELVLIQTTNIPPAVTINIPTRFKYLPVLLLKIIDSSQCEFIQTYNCQTLTPTPSFTSTPTETPTNTPTPSITPSITPSSETPTPTPTISITPSETPTNTPTSSITPSITKTPTITPSITSSVTPTPTVTLTLSESVTPTPTVTLSLYTTPTVTTSATPTITPTPTIGTTISFRNYFLIFAEPSSGSTGLAEYMASRGSTFYGFSNGSSPSTNQVEFERQMNLYMSYSGFTNSAGGFRVYTNVDYENEILYGNPNVDRNFRLTKITANTLSVNSWYTIFIFTGFTLSQKQSTIGIGLGQSDYLTSVNTNSDFYNLSVYYTGGSYIQFATYRVYTTFPSSEMFLNNENLNIFFKGLNLT